MKVVEEIERVVQTRRPDDGGGNEWTRLRRAAAELAKMAISDHSQPAREKCLRACEAIADYCDEVE